MKAYAIKHPQGNILPWYISFYAGQTKDKAVKDYVPHYKSWKEMYKAGYRCVPIEITEIKK
jgi:hypothetical protein